MAATPGNEPVSLQALAEQVGELGGKVDGLAEGLGAFVTSEEATEEQERVNDELKAGQRRFRKVLRILAVSVAFDICLSVGFGVLALKTRDTTNQLKTAQKQAVTSCQAANQARSLEQQLWNYVLSLSATSPPPNQTPQQKADADAKTAQFKQYLNTVFAQRDCNLQAPGVQGETKPTKP